MNSIFFTIIIFTILSAFFAIFFCFSFRRWYSMTIYIIFIIFRFVMNCFWSTLCCGIGLPGIICIIFTIIFILSFTTECIRCPFTLVICKQFENWILHLLIAFELNFWTSYKISEEQQFWSVTLQKYGHLMLPHPPLHQSLDLLVHSPYYQM